MKKCGLCEYLCGDLCKDTGMPAMSVEYCGIREEMAKPRVAVTLAMGYFPTKNEEAAEVFLKELIDLADKYCGENYCFKFGFEEIGP